MDAAKEHLLSCINKDAFQPITCCLGFSTWTSINQSIHGSFYLCVCEREREGGKETETCIRDVWNCVHLLLTRVSSQRWDLIWSNSLLSSRLLSGLFEFFGRMLLSKKSMKALRSSF